MVVESEWGSRGIGMWTRCEGGKWRHWSSSMACGRSEIVVSKSVMAI